MGHSWNVLLFFGVSECFLSTLMYVIQRRKPVQLCPTRAQASFGACVLQPPPSLFFSLTNHLRGADELFGTQESRK